MTSGLVFNLAYVLASVVGVGGLQFVFMHRAQKRQLQAQADQSKAAASNSEVQTAQLIQTMAIVALQAKETELTKLRTVVAGLVAYIKSVPELPDMPAEIEAVVKGWGG